MELDSQYATEKTKFDKYYEQNILMALQKIEKTRKKYFGWFISLCLITFIWMAYIVINFKEKMLSTPEDNPDFGLVMCLIVLAVCAPMFLYYKRSKESILPLIIGYFGKFEYEYKRGISETLLIRSRIMPQYDSLETDDGFYGTYDNVAVGLTEYTLKRRERETKGNTKQYKYVKKGHGIIFQSQMNKKFEGQTIVVKDKGILNTFTHYAGFNRVGLESLEFEKAYEVFSDNQIEARYILTATMLEYMMQLKQSFKNISYSFFDNKVLINIEIKENFFECSSFFNSVINKKRIDKIFNQFYQLFAIIKTLQLNQKKLL